MSGKHDACCLDYCLFSDRPCTHQLSSYDHAYGIRNYRNIGERECAEACDVLRGHVWNSFRVCVPVSKQTKTFALRNAEFLPATSSIQLQPVSSTAVAAMGRCGAREDEPSRIP